MEVQVGGRIRVAVIAQRLPGKVRDALQFLLGGQQIVIGSPAYGAALPRQENEIDQRFERIVDLVSDSGGHPSGGGKLFRLDEKTFDAFAVGNIASNL